MLPETSIKESTDVENGRRICFMFLSISPGMKFALNLVIKENEKAHLVLKIKIDPTCLGRIRW